jgi:predicted RNA-binding protein with PUA-like domain
VAGLARVVRTRVVDETQFDPSSKYFDPKATREKPIWDCVDVEFVTRTKRFLPLGEIREEPSLSEMPLLKKGMRLSVQPVTEAQYRTIVALSKKPAPKIVEKPKPKAHTKPKKKR